MTKEQKAQEWVANNHFMHHEKDAALESYIAGYEQGDGDAVVRSMVFIERQGVKLANVEYELLLVESTNKKLQQQINTLTEALHVIKDSDNYKLSMSVARAALASLTNPML